jgi:predicted porin
MTPIRACLLAAASLTAAGVAHAQTAASSPPASTEDSSLTWKGITLYGIVDIGVQYNTHSAPYSDYFPTTSGSLVQKNDYDSPTGLTGNNLSQSRIGISGNEPLFGDWAGVFKLETFFNPQSGDISDALKALTLNNGKSLTQQNVAADSSVAGQMFAGAAYAGLSSPTVGTFTFGRNVTLVADGINKYDPMGAAYAFSVIGWSGTAAGGGDTEDRRLDDSIKYIAKYGPVHLGALYQFGSQSGSTDTGYQFQLGGEFAGFSADAFYFKKYDAISVSSLSAGQAQDVTNNCINDATTTPAPTPVRCYSMSTALAGTISDNHTYAIMALYNFGDVLPLKLYGGYEKIFFDNPTDPLSVGTPILGGYVLAVVNNTAYDNQKTLQVFWGGLKWSITPDLDFTAAYYGYKQNSYATGKDAGCTTNVSGGCSGNENAISGLFDYRLTKRFDIYFGSMWSGVQNGLANGYLFDDNIATTLGARFKF